MNTISKTLGGGVEYKKLGEVCEIIRGKGLSKGDISEGDAPIILYGELYTTYGNYITEIKSTTKSDKIKNSPVVLKGDLLLPISSTTKEAQIGKVSAYRSEVKSFLGGDALLLRHQQNDGFLMYLLNSSWFERLKMKTVKGTTINHLDVNKFKEITIPLPPIPVQEEIVRILDTLTSLQTNLQTELELRKKQYQYYRDKLLSFEDIDGGGGLVEYKRLGEIAVRITSGGTPLTSKKEYYNGSIPWLNTKEVKDCHIYKTEKTITDLGLKNSSAKWIEKNSVIVAMYGATAGKVAINKIPLTTNQACCNITLDATKADYNYVYYILLNSYEELVSMVSGGAQKNLNAGMISDFKIPLPPLEEQKRIVGILDQFDKLVNDISEGIPAEIEMRRKQYEYYRDMLLRFEAG